MIQSIMSVTNINRYCLRTVLIMIDAEEGLVNYISYMWWVVWFYYLVSHQLGWFIISANFYILGPRYFNFGWFYTREFHPTG